MEGVKQLKGHVAFQGHAELKEVQFDIYCKRCKYRDYKEAQDPCNDCLEVAMREGTHVPEYWEGNNVH